MENEKPSTSINIPLQMEPTSSHSTTITTGPLSLEMFNHAATNLNDKGVINLKKYSKYLYRKSKPNLKMNYPINKKMPQALFIQLLTNKALMLKKTFKGH